MNQKNQGMRSEERRKDGRQSSNAECGTRNGEFDERQRMNGERKEQE
jgi:hypothetical protein